MSDPAQDLEAIIEGYRERGFSEEEIRGILRRLVAFAELERAGLVKREQRSDGWATFEIAPAPDYPPVDASK